jgi:hypothetical protein
MGAHKDPTTFTRLERQYSHRNRDKAFASFPLRWFTQDREKNTMIFHPRLAVLLKRLFGPFGMLTRYHRIKERDGTKNLLQLGQDFTADREYLLKALVNKDLELGMPVILSKFYLAKKEFELH